jgi:hypothetical protein
VITPAVLLVCWTFVTAAKQDDELRATWSEVAGNMTRYVMSSGISSRTAHGLLVGTVICTLSAYERLAHVSPLARDQMVERREKCQRRPVGAIELARVGIRQRSRGWCGRAFRRQG